MIFGTTHLLILSRICNVSVTMVNKLLKELIRVKYYLTCKTLNILANALVFPYFDYCNPVQSNCNLNCNAVQILQNKLARVLLSADIGTPVDNLLCDLNWIRLDKRWKIKLLQVVFKCLKNDASSYLSSQFIFTSTIHPKNTRSQASNTRLMPSLKKSNLVIALFIIEEALCGIAFQLTTDVIYLP